MRVLLFALCGCTATMVVDDPVGEAIDPPGEDLLPTAETPDPTLPGTSAPEDCPPVDDQTRAAIVTDIDETLTTSDNEWLTQIVLPDHDPEMRPDADVLMRGFVEKGYRVFYLTARGGLLRLLDGTTARDATEDWLDQHGFPYTSDGVFLADGLGALLDAQAESYKTETLLDLEDAGFDLVYAFGNAESDIAAYKNAGIPDEDIFLVGVLAGQMGVEAIPTPNRYTDFLPFLDQVPCGH